MRAVPRRPAVTAAVALAAAVVALLLAAAVLPATSAGAVGATERQEAPATLVPCDDGTPGPSAAPVAGQGPSPVGRCEPSRKQKALDLLVWVWVTLALVGGTAALALLQRRAARRGAAEGDARAAAEARAEADGRADAADPAGSTIGREGEEAAGGAPVGAE